MGFKDNIDVESGPGLRKGPMILALMVSSISMCISAAAGSQRGGSDGEKLLLAAVSIVAVMGAHLLPAMCQRTPLMVRFIGSMLWLMCTIFVAYGHAGYFLSAQQKSGHERAAALPPGDVNSTEAPKRKVSAIFAELAKLKAMQAHLATTDCAENCAQNKARQVMLQARSQMLEAEADEVKRWQVAHDQRLAKQNELRNDLVSTRLAQSLGVPYDSVSLFTGLLFAVILEGLGCLLWHLAFLGRDSAVISSVTPLVTSKVTPDDVINAAIAPAPSELELLATQVRPAIEDGRVKCTVQAIRKYLKCSQEKAAAVRRLVSEVTTETASSHPR